MLRAAELDEILQALADAVQSLAPSLEVLVAESLDQLARQVAEISRAGDLVLAMGAGDVNSLWERLALLEQQDQPTTALAA